MRVVILPTGRTEWYGLPRALARLFPGHEFTPVPTRSEIDSNLEAFPAPGFTAHTVFGPDRVPDSMCQSPPKSWPAQFKKLQVQGGVSGPGGRERKETGR